MLRWRRELGCLRTTTRIKFLQLTHSAWSYSPAMLAGVSITRDMEHGALWQVTPCLPVSADRYLTRWNSSACGAYIPYRQVCSQQLPAPIERWITDRKFTLVSYRSSVCLRGKDARLSWKPR